MFASIDWAEMLLPSLNPLEVVLRGSLMYVGTFVLLRIVAKRELGALSVSDLIVVVFIADAAQNGMAGAYRSVFDGLLLVGVLIAWAYALDRLAFHWQWFERLVKPPPLQVVRAGRLLRKNMRREYLTESELLGSIREQGLTELADVEAAFVESDGSVSVIPKKGGP